MYVAYVIIDSHASGLAYKIGFDKTRMHALCKQLAATYPHAVSSRRTTHVLNHGDICIESDVTRSLHGKFVDCDFVIQTRDVTPCEDYIVMRIVKHQVSNSCISSSSCRASTKCDLTLTVPPVKYVLQGVRDDVMRDVTWYNVQVHGDDEEAVRTHASRIAALMKTNDSDVVK